MVSCNSRATVMPIYVHLCRATFGSSARCWLCEAPRRPVGGTIQRLARPGRHDRDPDRAVHHLINTFLIVALIAVLLILLSSSPSPRPRRVTAPGDVQTREKVRAQGARASRRGAPNPPLDIRGVRRHAGVRHGEFRLWTTASRPLWLARRSSRQGRVGHDDHAAGPAELRLTGPVLGHVLATWRVSPRTSPARSERPGCRCAGTRRCNGSSRCSRSW